MPKFEISMKQRIVIALLATVLISAILVGGFGQMRARNLVTERVESVELPNTLQRIRNKIDKEISVLEQATEQLARIPMVESFMLNGRPSSEEREIVELLKRMQKQYQLTNASVVDRETAHYWNQDGFLRVLNNDERDGWFFAFRSSGEQKSKSLYSEDNIPKLFINYQDLDGRVASGIGRSVKEFVDLLNSNKIGESGFVFLVDKQGTVKLHQNQSLLESASIASLYGSDVSRALLREGDFSLQTVTLEGGNYYLASSYIASANWYVVAQVPLSEVFAELDDALVALTIEVLVMSLLFGLGAAWLGGKMSRPLSDLAQTFSKLGESEANLEVELQQQKEKELKELQHGFNQFIHKIKQTILQIGQSSSQLKGVSESVATQASQVLELSQTQANKTEQVTAAVNQLDESVQTIADTAELAADTAEELKQVSYQGTQVSIKAKEAIKELTSHTAEVAESIDKLVEHAESIEGVLNVIKSVSEQTNLLALNAAIEAARAGEQGRGFAVVADEVRSLAKRTHDSTDEIGETILRLQEEVQKVVSLMATSQQKSSEGDEAVEQNEEALRDIETKIDNVLELNKKVASTTEQQAQMAHTIKENIDDIRADTDTFLSSSNKVSSSSIKLQELADKLDEMVSQYK